MTDIHDKAEETPEIDLAIQSAPGAYILEDTELEPANSLTDEGDFPQYGEFLPVRRARATDGGHEPSGGEMWIECPQALAQFLVESGIEIGEGFRIKQVRKIDGTWDYDCETLG